MYSQGIHDPWPCFTYLSWNRVQPPLGYCPKRIFNNTKLIQIVLHVRFVETDVLLDSTYEKLLFFLCQISSNFFFKYKSDRPVLRKYIFETMSQDTYSTLRIYSYTKKNYEKLLKWEGVTWFFFCTPHICQWIKIIGYNLNIRLKYH